MAETKKNTVMDALRENGVMRSRDLAALGVSAPYVKELADRGQLTQIGRGLFTLPSHCYTENHSLVQVAAHSPRSTICLLSALQFHGLTMTLPSVVWVAIPTGAYAPHIAGLGLRVVRMSKAVFELGVDVYTLEGVTVRIYSAAKTAADCFYFRSYVGMEIAVNALREGLEKRLFSPAEVLEYAMAARVLNVMLPYVEALT